MQRRRWIALFLLSRGDRGRLPAIYVSPGLQGRCSSRWRTTMVFALVGSLIVTLTLLAGAVLVVHAKGRGSERRTHAAFEAIKSVLHQRASIFVSPIPGGSRSPRPFFLGGSLLLHPRASGAEFMPPTGMKARYGWRANECHTPISFDESAKIGSQGAGYIALLLPDGHHGSPRNWAGPTTAPIPPDFSTSSFTLVS